MFRDRTVSLVIPAYNEEETIGQVVEEFLQEPHLPMGKLMLQSKIICCPKVTFCT